MIKTHIGQLPTNLVADTDAYKQGHASLINPNLTHLETYGEARTGGKYPWVAFFGMQALIAKHFLTPITKLDLDEACEQSLSINGISTIDRAPWLHIINNHGGLLPITIKTVPEGTILKEGNVLFTTACNDPKIAKIMNAIETLQMHVWKPTAVLTRCAKIKSSIYPYFIKSGNVDMIDYAVNDFGLRGTSCIEDGGVSGMAALIAFAGSDNNRAGRELKAYYEGVNRQASVMATEHSVALSFGRGQGELDYMNHVLDTVPNDMIFSIVIDTYDAHGFIRNVAGNPEIVEKIKARNGRVVFRPDSGNPEFIVPEILSLLAEIYGYSINEKGYRVLNHNVGIIQGDGMNENSIPALYNLILNLGWSADNLVVGSGGGLLVEGLTRDTQRFAIKPSYGIINEKPLNFKKNPATDPTKASKSGRLKLHGFDAHSYSTYSSANMSESMFNAYHDSLRVLYKNGEIFPENFETIKNRFEDHLRQIGTF